MRVFKSVTEDMEEEKRVWGAGDGKEVGVTWTVETTKKFPYCGRMKAFPH